MKDFLHTIAKAIAGGVAATSALWVAANADGTLTNTELVNLVFAFVGGGFLVWLVPNKADVPKP